MKKFFNAENWLWKPLGYLGDLVMLSLLWTVLSVPIVTLGPASAALYDAAVHSIRRREDTVIARFLSTFRRELKQGVLSTLVWLGVVLAAAALFFALILWLPVGTEQLPILAAAALLLGFFLLCVLCWVYPVLSRFSMELRALHSTSLRLALGHILRSAAMALVWGASLYVGLRFVAPLFVCPALAALLSSLLIEPIFKQYEEQG